MAQIDELLSFLKENGGSDLHLAAGLEPRFRGKGKLQPIPGKSVLADGELRTMLQEIASAKQWHEFESTNDLDFAYGIGGPGRFRANYFVQQNGAGAVFRIIPEEIITLEQP